MPRKKKKKEPYRGPSGHFSLKTRATEDLDKITQQYLSGDHKDRPLKDVFDMYEDQTETEEQRLARERAEDELEDDAIEDTVRMQKDNDERTRWY